MNPKYSIGKWRFGQVLKFFVPDWSLDVKMARETVIKFEDMEI